MKRHFIGGEEWYMGLVYAIDCSQNNDMQWIAKTKIYYNTYSKKIEKTIYNSWIITELMIEATQEQVDTFLSNDITI